MSQTDVSKIRRALPLSEEVYRYLKELILSNKLLPGSLIKEEQLARDLGISRTPLRVVLSRLEAEGLVRKIPNKGTLVSEISLDDVRQIYEMRDTLERFAARRSALNIPLSKLESLLDQSNLVADRIGQTDYDLHHELHAALHQLILAYADNEFLVRMIRSLDDHMRRVRALSGTQPERHAQKTQEEQRELLDALIARDPDRAELAIVRHIDNSYKRIAAQLAESEIPTDLGGSIKKAPLEIG